ncbi:MAG: hypothetical protein CMJ42_15125 [Phyllobacteriaceae bacterium]|nr:hypothetical protein [Phyllobacteriaceae bacterium]
MFDRKTVLAGIFILTTLLFSLDFPSPPPPEPVGPYLNGVFPTSAPGSSWDLEDALPGMAFIAPLKIVQFPNSDDILLLDKIGEIWRISLTNQTSQKVLDIADRTFDKGEGGTVGMALHPSFGDPSKPDKQTIFIFYRSKPNPDEFKEIGFNRLSKFSWNAQSQKFDPDSEEILIQQYDRKTWHNGGGMFFGPDGFLYLSVGDEGDTAHIAASNQRLDGGFFSGILRIDVDNDPTRSHPIRRQPRPNANPPSGWWPTFSQGYSIPDDNPWLSQDSSILEEFWAIGIRSPFSTSYDSETDLIWVCDVGHDAREEISFIQKGDNLQWPFMEGTVQRAEWPKPDSVIGNERPAFFDYDRSIGGCVIGGIVYRHTHFPELNGKFLFSDWLSDKFMALSSTGTNPELEILIPNISATSAEIPDNPGVASIFQMDNGEILVTVMGQDVFAPGKIYRLVKNEDVPEPPSRLSELGVFADLNTLEPAAGLIEYEVNSPLWSDRAVKKRWLAIPNDGFFSDENRVRFSRSGEWTFPPGTVFVKQFDLPKSIDPNGELVPLETRFLVVDKNGQAYGLTYQWNEEGTEAYLLGGGASREIEIEENGQFAFSQKWDYPSRDQCLSCHTPNAKYVLGLKTHQLNRDKYFPSVGHSMNQLEFLEQMGMFDRPIDDPEKLPQAYAINDSEAELEQRVRSYFDSNCSHCHRPNGVNDVNIDLRYSTPLALQNIVATPTNSHSSDPNRQIVEPGSHATSELWIRDASLNSNRMPPIGRNLVDETYIQALAEWIDQLSPDAGKLHTSLIYPNPTDQFLNIRVRDNWPGPFNLQLFGANGSLVLSHFSEENAIGLDLGGYPSGIYFLEIVNSTGEREQYKLLVK